MQKVLVVDDELEIREMLIRCLEREGFEGLGFSDGKSVLDYLEKNSADLIILDIMMTDLDGFEVLRELRGRAKNIPVIFLSARQEEYDKVLGLGLGADDYVTKPFSPGELMARVKVQLRKRTANSPQNSPQVLSVGELVMDLKSYQITLDGKPVELAGKEILLLKFFMEHPGQVFTKAQIYHQVWDENFEDDNTVMVYISHLRDKLENSSENHLEDSLEKQEEKCSKNPSESSTAGQENREWIQTIRGIGYRFGGDR